jgi:hypothetical protein
MLFKSILFWISASFIPNIYVSHRSSQSQTYILTNQAAAINDLRDTSQIIDLNALTQNPTAYYHPSSNTSSSTTLNSTLSKRYNFQTPPFKCHGNDFGYAEVDHIVSGIKHLTTNIKGQPSNSPMSCGRVSCSNNAAIWWCNLVRPLSFPLPFLC